MSTGKNRQYEFGTYRLDVAERLLWKQGQVVPLTAKVFDLLVVLVENQGRLLEKEHLLKTLWPDSFVEEANLSVNISTLRKALGELPQEAQYIETVTKKGYRFVALVTEVTEDERPAHDSGELAAQAIESPRPARLKRAAVVAGLLATCVIAYSIWHFTHRNEPPSTVGLRSIAVLPFHSLKEDESQDYLGLGMADALITRLTHIRRISVRPTSAIQKYSSPTDPLAAGRELDVDALVEGRIQRSDESIRVTVQLLRVRDGAPLWGQTFDDRFSNIFQVQDAISERLAAALALKLTEPERRVLTKRHTDNTEAYQLYLQGQYLASKRTQAGTQSAIEYYLKAASADPDYALPYAELATSYLAQAGVGLGDELWEKARTAAAKALGFDPELAEAYVAQGQVLMRADWDWAGAAAAFDRALVIDPDLAKVHWAKSTLLTVNGVHADAIQEMQLACRLDPTSAAFRSDLGWTFYCARRYDEAIENSRKAVQMDPWSFTAHRELAQACLMKSMQTEAIAECQKTLDLVGGRRSRELAELGRAYAASGMPNEARAILAELNRRSRTQPRPHYEMALLEASLGEKEAALESLENACRQRLSRAIWMNVDPALDTVRGDPRFAELLRRNHLAPRARPGAPALLLTYSLSVR